MFSRCLVVLRIVSCLFSGILAMPDTKPETALPPPSTPVSSNGHKKHKRSYEELERENHKLRDAQPEEETAKVSDPYFWNCV